MDDETEYELFKRLTDHITTTEELNQFIERYKKKNKRISDGLACRIEKRIQFHKDLINRFNPKERERTPFYQLSKMYEDDMRRAPLLTIELEERIIKNRKKKGKK